MSSKRVAWPSTQYSTNNEQLPGMAASEGLKSNNYYHFVSLEVNKIELRWRLNLSSRLEVVLRWSLISFVFLTPFQFQLKLFLRMGGGGWVAGSNGNKTNLASIVEVELI